MLREGEKEEKERAQREGAGRRKEILRSMILMRERREKTALMSEVDRGYVLTNQEYRNQEKDIIIRKKTSDGTNMPIYTASVSQLGGEVLGEEIIHERSQDINDETIHAQNQGILLSINNGLAPGSA